ncbi:MAG: universal stress protein [Bacteroidota bacterium]
MFKILVPTDFSAHAHNALAYAIDLANAVNGSIEVLHIYQVYSTTGMFVSVASHLERDAQTDMDALLQKFRPRLQPTAQLSGKILKGDAIPMICSHATATNVDLIVMGTQGATGLKEIFIGSVTNGVLKQTRIPVLAIPKDGSYQSLKSIVLAVDDNAIEHKETIGVLLQLSKALSAHLLIFHQDDGDDDLGVHGHLHNHLAGVEHSFHFELNRNAISESIRDFAATKNAGMLAMIRRKRGLWEGLFHVSATTREVFETEIPLLVLNEV